MRLSRPASLLVLLVLILSACASSGPSSSAAPSGTGSASSSNQPSTAPCSSTSAGGSPAPGCVPPSGGGQPTPGATPGYTTGPSGIPIGDWVVTLVNGPTPGEYRGRDEMTCVGLPDDPSGPISVAFLPLSAPPLQHVAASSLLGGSISVTAGSIESTAIYQAATGQRTETVAVTEASIDAAGIVHLSVEGTQQYPGEDKVREFSLEADCPLFPPDEG